jgi:hypothetical protein
MRAPVVLRFASVRPAALSRIRMHARRSAGDLDHIHPAARSVPVAARNEFHEGGPPPVDDWVEKFHETTQANALANREAKALAAEVRGKKKEAGRIRREPPTKPYREGKGGPLREGILTASADWFAEDTSRVQSFKKEGLAFLRKQFGKDLIHVRYDLDEAAPHFHFVVGSWVEEMTLGGAKVKVLRPRSNPLIADYEKAQDEAGRHFLPLGLIRGQSRRVIQKAAKAAGVPPPPKRHHKTPSAHRADLKERETTATQAVQGAMDFKADALKDAADTVRQGMAEVAAQRAALAEQAKAVRSDARRLGLAISNATGEASDYEAAPNSPTAAKAVERAAAIQEAKKKKAQELREAAARKAIKAAAIAAGKKAGWSQGGGPGQRSR